MNQRSELAISTVIGSVLIVGITVSIGAGLYFLLPDAEPQDIIRSEIRLDDRNGQYLEPVGGDVLSANETVIRVQTENGFEEKTLYELGVGKDWNVGERVCVVGDAATCMYRTGTKTERITIVGNGQVISSVGTDQLGGGGLAADPKPDLTVSFASATPTPNVGQDTTFSFTVTNGGPEDAGPFSVSFSHNGIGKTPQTVNSLASGASITLSESETVVAGTHTWAVTADSLDNVDESNELNNAVSYAYSATDTLPDITVTFLDVNPAPKKGQDSVFRFQVALADADAGAFDVTTTLDGVQVQTDNFDLAQGGTGIVSYTWNGPAGAHTLLVTADSGSAVSESNEGNNVAQYDFTPQNPKPDLLATFVSVNPTPQDGTESTFTFQIENIGQTASGTYTIQVSRDGATEDIPAANMQPGGSIQIPLTWTTTEGSHTISITVDSEDSIEEQSEENNAASHTFTTSPPPTTDPIVVDVGKANLQAIGAGDVDGDGDDDLIVGDYGTYLHFIENDGGIFAWDSEKKTNSFISHIEVGEFTGKHDNEDVFAGFVSGEVKLYSVGGKNVNIQEKKNLKDPGDNTHMFQFGLADINGDSLLDVIAGQKTYTDPGGSYYKLQEPNGDFSGKEGDWEQIGAVSTRSLVAFDAEGTNDVDVFTGDETSPEGRYLYEQKSWGWQQHSSFQGSACGNQHGDWSFAAVQSGQDDAILMPCLGSGSGPCLVLATAQGNNWIGESLIDCEWNANSDCAKARLMNAAKFVDLDNDGDQDIVAADKYGVAYHFKNDGAGNFVKSCHYFGSNLSFQDMTFFQLDVDNELEIALVANDKNIYIMDGIF